MGIRSFSSIRKEEILEHIVKNLSTGQTAILQTDDFNFAFCRKFFIGKIVYILQNDKLCPLAHHIYTHDKSVTATQRTLIFNGYFRNHEVNALFMELSKAYPQLFQKFMSRMLHIVLIVCIVDNTLNVALIIADLHLEFKTVLLHNLPVSNQGKYTTIYLEAI